MYIYMIYIYIYVYIYICRYDIYIHNCIIYVGGNGGNIFGIFVQPINSYKF